MADTSTSEPAPEAAKSQLAPTLPPTPEATPEPTEKKMMQDKQRQAEQDRTNNDKAEKDKEDRDQDVAKLITHIQKYKKTDKTTSLKILHLSKDCNETDVLQAWLQKGCKIHPAHCQNTNASEAFEKLRRAAKKLNLSDEDEARVVEWDGEQDIEAEDDSDDSSDNESVASKSLHGDTLDPPPDRVKKLYQEATDYILQLMQDPDDSMVRSQVDLLNDRIVDENKKEGIKDKERWRIPLENLLPHFTIVMKADEALRQDGKYTQALSDRKAAVDIIHKCIEINHLPPEWAPMSTEDVEKLQKADLTRRRVETTMTAAKQALEKLQGISISISDLEKTLGDNAKKELSAFSKRLSEEGPKFGVHVNAAQSALEEAQKDRMLESAITASGLTDALLKSAEMLLKEAEAKLSSYGSEKSPASTTTDFPWPTYPAAPGGRILAVRKCGGHGHRALVETEIEGRPVRTLMAGADAGHGPVAAFLMLPNCKSLQTDKTLWTYKNRDKFVKLHWITQTQMKLHNAAGRRRDPEAMCFVTMTWGPEICPKSSLYTLLGRGDAAASIKKVCKRDQILAPWECQPKAEYLDYDGSGPKPKLAGAEPGSIRPSTEDQDDMKRRLDAMEKRMNEAQPSTENQDDIKRKMETMEVKMDEMSKNMHQLLSQMMTVLSKS